MASAVQARAQDWKLEPWLPAAIALGSVLLWLVFRSVPAAADVAWLQEATRRWVGGATLYVDIREINPPLIFYETAALSGGTLTNSAYVAGVAIVSGISSLWIARHHGPMLGLGAFIAMTFPGMTEFGQREHLLLIFVIPYLLARGSPAERTAMGLWAFLGVGLKPYFLPIVALPALVEAWRDPKSLFAAQKLALGGACIAYVAAAYLLHPAYFRDLVPLAQGVYTYGGSPSLRVLLEGAILIGGVLLADAERRPLGAAVIGAMLSFYLQGRFWPYHFMPAVGLGTLMFFWQRRLALWAALVMLMALQGPYVRDMHPAIPVGVERVAVLSSRPQATYPSVTLCGVTSVTPYASLGWVPTPWNIVTDPRSAPADRQRAWKILKEEREKLRHYIIAGDAQVILADARRNQAYIDRPIDYMRLVGPLPGFRFVRKVNGFEIWSKVPLGPGLCQR